MPSQLCQLLDVLDGCRGLDLGDNPWVEPPESIVREGMQNTREYFQDLYAESYRVQRNSVKIILVGQEGAGKTRWAGARGQLWWNPNADRWTRHRCAHSW